MLTALAAWKYHRMMRGTMVYKYTSKKYTIFRDMVYYIPEDLF